MLVYSIVITIWACLLSFLYENSIRASGHAKKFYGAALFMVWVFAKYSSSPSKKYIFEYVDMVLAFIPIYGLYYTLKRFAEECFPAVKFVLEVLSFRKFNTGYISSSSKGIECLVTSGLIGAGCLIFAELYTNYKRRSKELYKVKKVRPVIDKRLKRELSSNDPIMMKFDNISKTYSNGVEALRDVTFNIPKGTIFGILGPNGAGKSTLFNIAALQIKRAEGDISIEDKSIYTYKDNNTITLCPQRNRYWEYLTVREHLEFIAELKGLSPSNAKSQVILYH